jgi:hypothetical protein
MPTSLPVLARPREARDLAARLDLADLGEGGVRVDGQRIDDHAAFVALHFAHVVGLFVHRQIAVQDAHAAGLGHGDGEAAFGHRVHGGGHERDVQTDFTRELGLGRHLGGHDV